MPNNWLAFATEPRQTADWVLFMDPTKRTALSLPDGISKAQPVYDYFDFDTHTSLRQFLLRFYRTFHQMPNFAPNDKQAETFAAEATKRTESPGCAVSLSGRKTGPPFCSFYRT